MTGSGVETFGIPLLLAGVAGMAAVMSNRLSERLNVPAPAFFLVCAAIASELWTRLGGTKASAVEDVVTVALVIILFDGGMQIGLNNFITQIGATLWLGVVGTVVTAGAMAVLAHEIAGFGWRMALLLGTAVAPTDPAVVFSVLGRREIGGRAGVLLQGESGANDPVGIALMLALLGATGSAGQITLHVLTTFALEMLVGGAIGFGAARLLLLIMRRFPLPSEGLYSPRVLACVLAIYGVSTVLHGSGFLAVFVAGIVIGDEPAPYKREIQRFHGSLASLAEIVAFIMLGLTIQLRDVAARSAWSDGLLLAVLLVLVVRPVLVGLVTWRIRLTWRERLFLLWTGLKGAVPILLGMFIISSGIAGGQRAYDVIFVIVAFSVAVQGGLVPFIVNRLRIPVRIVEPEPWSLGVRFSSEPEGLHNFRVADGSQAAGTTIGQFAKGRVAWVSAIVRGGHLVTASADTLLQPGDEVAVLAEPESAEELRDLFEESRPPQRPEKAQ
ncbi:MAG TPA: cation:proton antiporter [Streptosporangiaceae bacterium]